MMKQISELFLVLCRYIFPHFHILVTRKKISWLSLLFLDRKLKRWKLIDVAKLFVAGTGPNFGPKMKLKTEIEQNENSIELLTLIFFSSPFTQSPVLTTGRYVWQEVMTETESLLGEKKILSHEKWMKLEKLLNRHAR